MQRSNLRDFLKSQKQQQQHAQEQFVEIFVSNAPQRAVRSSEALLTSDIVVVAQNDGCEFRIPEAVALGSGVISSMLTGFGDFREKRERRIELPDINSFVLEDIFRFLFTDYIENGPFNQTGDASDTRVTFLFALKPATVIELLIASNYLDIPALAAAAIRMLAFHVHDIESLVGLPLDTVRKIYERLSIPDLVRLESSPAHSEFGLETTYLWQRFAEKLNCTDWIRARHIPTYDSNTAAAAAASADIRRGVIEHEFEMQIEKLYLHTDTAPHAPSSIADDDDDDDAHSLSAIETAYQRLEELAEIYGPSMRHLRINVDALQQVPLSGREHPLIGLLARIGPQIEVLDFSGFTEWSEQLLVTLAAALAPIDRLHTLLFDGCELDERSIGWLVTHVLRGKCGQSLLRLSLAENQLCRQACSTLAEWLGTNHSLKYIDVSRNGISYVSKRSISQQADPATLASNKAGYWLIQMQTQMRKEQPHDVGFNQLAGAILARNDGNAAEPMHLSVGSNHVRLADIDHRNFAAFRHIVSLDLSGNALFAPVGLGSGSGSHLFVPLFENAIQIQELNLSMCSLNNEALQTIAGFFEVGDPAVQSLLSLNLSRNSFVDEDAVQHFLTIIRSNRPLQTLLIDENSLSEARLVDIADALLDANSHLRVFSMGRTLIGAMSHSPQVIHQFIEKLISAAIGEHPISSGRRDVLNVALGCSLRDFVDRLPTRGALTPLVNKYYETEPTARRIHF